MKPAAYNPRVDLQPKDAAYEKLARSIDEFGYVEPIVWNERTGNIVGGHQRFKILQQLGYGEINCVVVDLDDMREKALNIALNKIRGDWEIKKLGVLLEQLEETGIGYDVTGWDKKDVVKLFHDMKRKEAKIAEDDFDVKAEAEAIDEPVTQPGDIWLIGRHRLICADCRDTGQVSRLMAGAKAKMVFTDPPWNVAYGESNHLSWKQRTIKNDNMSSDEFYAFLLAAFKSMASVSEPGCVLYCVMSAQEWGRLMLALEETGYHWSSTIIWAKDRFVLSRKDYNTQYEPIYYGWLGSAARLCKVGDEKQSDLWQFDRPTKSPDHPTTKPVALAAKAILNSSHEGDVVLDLFGGSGTTMLACEQTNRACFMSECEGKYCDIIARRMAQHWNSDADIFLLRDGKKTPFSEVMEL
jgi:DNA modification methylase